MGLLKPCSLPFPLPVLLMALLLVHLTIT
jgi:hypothetical protein